MITVHEIEDSIHGLYLVEQSEAESPARLRAFFIDYGDGTNLTLVKNAEGIKIFGVEDTRIILGDPYIDRPLPRNFIERYRLKVHSLFFAVYERDPYVPDISYFPNLPDPDREQDEIPDAWIRISVTEDAESIPVASSTLFARHSERATTHK